MALFLDTSALVKLYRIEIGSPFLEQFLLDSGRIAFVSRLGAVELHSALLGKVRSGEVTLAATEVAPPAIPK